MGSGDAASFTEVDPLAFRTYDERSMAGKILHVDRNGDGLPGHPLLPGQHQPRRMSARRSGSAAFATPSASSSVRGGLTIGDVGWGKWEEIDLISTAPGTGGRYYGWPCYEGNHRQGSYQARPECPPQYAKEGTPQAHVPPSYEYQHSGGGAVIGGPTYTAARTPLTTRGDIFFGDYAQRFVKKLNVNSAGVVTSVENFATNWPGVDLELSPGGELVWADIGGGAIRKVVYTPGNASPIARLDANPTSGPAPLDVSFSGSRSSDPDGDPLSYSWEFGDGGTSSQATPTHRYASAGTYIARLTVRDGRGGVGTDTETISAGNTPPALQVSGATTYRAGAPFQLQASVTDAQDQPFPGSRVSWDVRVVHGTHEHFIGTASGASLSQTAHHRSRRRLLLPDRRQRHGLRRAAGHRDPRAAAADHDRASAQQPLGCATRLGGPLAHRSSRPGHGDRLPHERQREQPVPAGRRHLRFLELVQRRRSDPELHRSRERRRAGGELPPPRRGRPPRLRA